MPVLAGCAGGEAAGLRDTDEHRWVWVRETWVHLHKMVSRAIGKRLRPMGAVCFLVLATGTIPPRSRANGNPEYGCTGCLSWGPAFAIARE